MELPRNLCIVLHCLKDEADEILVNQNLFVRTEELFDFLYSIKQSGYNFCLPQNARSGEKNCVVTFDDGYANNLKFERIAQELHVPYILFLAAGNVENQWPFIWDWAELNNRSFGFLRENYEEAYWSMAQAEQTRLRNSVHRPIAISELKQATRSQYFHVGHHSYYHQPFTRRFRGFVARELELSNEFYSRHNLPTLNHFAQPNGLQAFGLGKDLKDFDYIYTIAPGSFNPNRKYLKRHSLISPSVGRSLKEQVVMSNSPLRRLKRTVDTMYLSHR